MTDPDIALRDGESLITDVAEILYRQITEHMKDGDRVASTAFGPMPIDRDMPSFSRGSVVSAQQARDWHTQIAASPSLGVWAVTAGEVMEARRWSIDDSGIPLAEDENRAPGHCYVDYRNLSRPQRKELRVQLWMRAMERGEIPTDDTPPADGLF